MTIATNADDPNAVLTTTDVAARLGYSEAQVRRMCEAGRFDGDAVTGVPGAYRAGVGAHWRIPVAAVELFMRRQLRSTVVRRLVAR
jgi:hypothetical protein